MINVIICYEQQSLPYALEMTAGLRSGNIIIIDALIIKNGNRLIYIHILLCFLIFKFKVIRRCTVKKNAKLGNIYST